MSRPSEKGAELASAAATGLHRGFDEPPASGRVRAPEVSADDALLDALRKDLEQARNENLALKGRLKQLSSEGARTADDFASAFANSLDVMQSSLGGMHNAVSNFAVRELSLEASVLIEVSELGTVRYRFPGMSDEVPSERLSKLKLSVVPTAKVSSAGSWSGSSFTPQVPLEQIPGIAEYREKLNAHQLYTLADLLQVATRLRSQVELAALLGVDHKRLSDWVASAELMTVRGLDGHAAELLRDLGVHNLSDLAGIDPEPLLTRYNSEVEKRAQEALKPLALETLDRWVRTARDYMGQRERVADGTR